MKSDPGEILSLLCLRGADITKPGGGKPTLTPQDVAAALAYGNIYRESACLLWIKYCAEWRYFAELEIRAFNMCARLATEQRWRVRKPGWRKHEKWGASARLRVLSMAALLENIGTNQCPICEGRAEFQIGDVRRVCPKCEGSGIEYLSNRRIAEAMDIDESTYRNTWSPRYKRVCAEVDLWENDGLAALKRIGRESSVAINPASQ